MFYVSHAAYPALNYCTIISTIATGTTTATNTNSMPDSFARFPDAILMTAFTTWMVKYISEGAGDPDNIEYGKFGQHSRELLLLCQPMMLAWAWKALSHP